MLVALHLAVAVLAPAQEGGVRGVCVVCAWCVRAARVASHAMMLALAQCMPASPSVVVPHARGGGGGGALTLGGG